MLICVCIGIYIHTHIHSDKENMSQNATHSFGWWSDSLVNGVVNYALVSLSSIEGEKTCLLHA